MSTVQSIIEQRLTESFEPSHLSVVNESAMHNVPPGSESHFKVVLAASVFDGQRKVARHQAVYALLGDLMQGGVHALALHLYTPEEWAALGGAPASPECLGGGRS